MAEHLKILLHSVILWEKNFGCPKELMMSHFEKIPWELMQQNSSINLRMGLITFTQPLYFLRYGKDDSKGYTLFYTIKLEHFIDKLFINKGNRVYHVICCNEGEKLYNNIIKKAGFDEKGNWSVVSV